MKVGVKEGGRFLSKVGICFDDKEKCWEWLASLDKDGYGQFRHGKRMVKAHRMSYELFVGAIPMGMEIDHLCQNKKCVKPSHLQAVDHRTNMARSRSFSGVNSRKTHCVNGHEFSEDNTYLWNGWRSCKQCGKNRDKQRNTRRKHALEA